MSGPCYELILYVAGASDRSAHAIADARLLCDTHLAGRHSLRVVDVHDDPAAASGNGVLATPTLVKCRPPPVRRLVGDLSRTANVLRALELPGVTDTGPPRVGTPASDGAGAGERPIDQGSSGAQAVVPPPASCQESHG